MPSQPPPLPSLSATSTPWWDSSRSGSSSEPSRINWSVILASASVSFALIVSVIAWIVTHPNKAAGSLESPSVTVVTRVVELPANPPAPLVSPPPHVVPVIETTPARHRLDRRESIANLPPLLEETPPPLPPPAPQPQREPEPAVVQAAAQLAGETYGTQVLFRNNQEAAVDLARRDRKLLFVMHISGNFEDSCFT